MSYEKVIEHTLLLIGHLSEFKDNERPEIVVLTGHLVIETLLKEIIRKNLKSPSSVDIKRLKFSQALNWSKALVGDEHISWEWGCIRLLNKIRNEFAHELDRTKFDDCLNQMVETIEMNYQGISFGPNYNSTQKANLAIKVLHGQLCLNLQT